MRKASCPLCGGFGFSLGGLGRLVWYRCRDCGCDFSRKGKDTHKRHGRSK